MAPEAVTLKFGSCLLAAAAASLIGCQPREPREPAPAAPALDADGDGIPDGDDACPRQAEDPDRFQDEDGCPDAVNVRRLREMSRFERTPARRWRRASSELQSRLLRRGSLFALARGDRAFVGDPAAIVDLASGREERVGRGNLLPQVSRSFGRFTGSPLWAAGGATSPSGAHFVTSSGGEVVVVAWEGGALAASTRLPDSDRSGRRLTVARFLSAGEVAIFDRCRLYLWRWRGKGRPEERWSRCGGELVPLRVARDGARWFVAALDGDGATIFDVDIAGRQVSIAAEFVGRPLGVTPGWACWVDRSAGGRETVCSDLEGGREYRLGAEHESAVFAPGGRRALFGRGIGADHQLELVDFADRTIEPVRPASGFGSTYRTFLDRDRFVVGGPRIRIFDLSRRTLSTGAPAGARSSWEQVIVIPGRIDRFLQTKGVGSRQDLYAIER